MIIKLSFGKQLRRLRLPELTLEEVEDAFFDFYPDFFATKMRFVVRPEDFPTKEVVELSSEKDFARIVAVAKDAGKRSIKIHVSVAEDQPEEPVCEPPVQGEPVVNEMGNGGSISSYFDDVKKENSSTAQEEPVPLPPDMKHKPLQEPFQEPPQEPPQEPFPELLQKPFPEPLQEPPQEPYPGPQEALEEPFPEPEPEPLPELEVIAETKPQTEVPPPSHVFERVDPPSRTPDRAELHHSYDIPPPPQSPPPLEGIDQYPVHQEDVSQEPAEVPQIPQEPVEIPQELVEIEQEIDISQELPPLEPVEAPQEPETWACPRCTLKNSMDARQCSLCTLLRPGLKPCTKQPGQEQEQPANEINKPIPPQVLPVIDEKESAVNGERGPGHIPRIFGQIGRKVSGIFYGQNSQSSLDETEEKMAEASKNMMKPQPGHFYVQCNNCLQEIFGVRYKCFVCDNFNLCSVCDSKIDIDPMVQHDPLHAFIRIKTPAQCPQRGILAQRNQNSEMPQDFLHHRIEICSKLGFDKGQKYEPSQDIVVGWRLRNNGFTTVPHGTTLEPWDKWNTDQITCPHALQLPALAPNDEIEARLNIRTPPRPGVYKSTWRLKTPPIQAHVEDINANRHFGDKFQLTITVFSPFSLKREEKLAQLFDMGFEDRVRNIELLSKHKWDVFRVIALLTGEVQ